MDCKDIHEHITAAVDGRLDRSLHTEFVEHLHTCVRCASEYELERATKFMTQTKLQFVETPGHVRAAILDKIKAEASAERPAVSWWDQIHRAAFNMFTPRSVMPAVGLALIVVAIVGIALYNHPFWKTPAVDNGTIVLANQENEVLHQALNNFHDVTQGKTPIQLSSSEPSAVKAFFRNKVNFDVDVHHLKHADLLGANYSEFRGVKLAHVIYRSGGHVIYVYQAGIKDVGNGSTLCARREIQDALAKKSIFMDSITTPPHHCCTVVWEERGILCSAVSTLPKNEMLATLKDQLDPETP